MKILLHNCCGPCSVYPVAVLSAQGHEITGYFFRSNIHPYTEMQKREEALDLFAGIAGFTVIRENGYDLEGFLRMAAFREADRCRFCYHARLSAAARIARHGRFDAFSTTLLYSRFQKHELIRETGEAVAAECGVPFFYEDFRKGWKEGIEESKRLKLYRQQYCGCIYSERERFFRPEREPGKK